MVRCTRRALQARRPALVTGLITEAAQAGEVADMPAESVLSITGDVVASAQGAGRC